MFEFKIKAATAAEALAFMAGLGTLKVPPPVPVPAGGMKIRADSKERGVRRLKLGRRERARARAKEVGPSHKTDPALKTPAANAKGKKISKEQETAQESFPPKRSDPKQKVVSRGWETIPEHHRKPKSGAKGPRKHVSVTGRQELEQKDRPKNRSHVAKATGGRNAGINPSLADPLSEVNQLGETRGTAGSRGASERFQVTGTAPLLDRLADLEEVPDQRMVKRPRYSDDFPALGRMEEKRQGGKAKVKE